MNMDKQTYKKYAEARAPKSPILKDCIFAFLIGGFICAVAEGLKLVYTRYAEMPEEDAGTLVSVTLVFFAVALTAIGLFDKIASHAGAGTLGTKRADQRCERAEENVERQSSHEKIRKETADVEPRDGFDDKKRQDAQGFRDAELDRSAVESEDV